MIQKMPDPEQDPAPGATRRRKPRAVAEGEAGAEAAQHEDPPTAEQRGVVEALAQDADADAPELADEGDEPRSLPCSEAGADLSAEADADAGEPADADADAGASDEVDAEQLDGAVESAQDLADDAAPAEPLGDVTAVDGPGCRDGLALTRRVEAVLFAASGPMAPRRLAVVLDVDLPLVVAALDALVARWAERDTSMELVAIAGGYRFMTRPIHAEDLAGLARKGRTENLSAAALETLAVVAYKQPIGRADIEAIRGVAAGPLLRVLLDRDLIRIAGRSKEPGHPLLYGTTKRFLDHFGLKSLKQLPDLKDLLDVR